MTTEEALAVADAVQFGKYDTDRSKDKAKLQDSAGDVKRKGYREAKYARFRARRDGQKQQARRHWEDPEYTPPGSSGDQHYKASYSSQRKKDTARLGAHGGVHIQKVEHMHFSLEAQKARIDRAERTAMRRMIEASPLPDRTKAALLLHSKRVQFADDGKEIPSVPLKWVVQAAVWQMSLETEG